MHIMKHTKKSTPIHVSGDLRLASSPKTTIIKNNFNSVGDKIELR